VSLHLHEVKMMRSRFDHKQKVTEIREK